MEAELLRGMIADRDTRIANVTHKQEALVIKEERLKEELSEAAETNSSQIITQQTEKTALFHEQQGVLHQLDNLQQHLHRQGESLSEYVQYIQQNGEIAANDAQNVMRLQAQLCKAMHSMSIVDRQHNLQKEHCEKLMKYLKEELAKQSEDKAHLERSILNGLIERDTEVRGVENGLKKQLDAIYKEMNAIRDQLDDSDSDEEDEPKEEEEDEEEEEELDEEEKAAKEEMMKLLQQRREEIEKLEKDIEEREEMIEELQIRAGEESSDESPRVPATTEKKVADDEKKEQVKGTKKESPKKETKKEEPVVDEMAARLQQVMASASTAKVDDVDEMDLLKLAQSRLTGGGDAGDDEKDDESDEEDETETEFDENDVDDVDVAETAKTQGDDDDYDPTEKKEDPIVES